MAYTADCCNMVARTRNVYCVCTCYVLSHLHHFSLFSHTTSRRPANNSSPHAPLTVIPFFFVVTLLGPAQNDTGADILEGLVDYPDDE